ncbi:MFS transporter [Leptospira meyeri]|uniref:MFS transporter n=1 Tax=Leptospira meyeri TaxID=29508 RepID=UPI0002BEFCB6|nr:MFS transporter [Leptospira meyeri]EMJ89969.1 transporter, major facilitator family protein [Leptospira meyeri serovar Semaranga str. Veldrot Semarang 173]
MSTSPKRIKFILFLIVFTDMMGFSLLFPLFPKTLEFFLLKGDDALFRMFYSAAHLLSFGGDTKYTFVLFGGILGSIYSFLQFIAAPVWGRLSDHSGRRAILLFTTLGNTIGYFLWLFSSQFWMFVLSRVMTGMMGGNLSVASAAMADQTDEKSRAAGMGFLGAGIGLGFVMGPLLGGISSQWTLLDSFYKEGSMVVFPASAFFAILVSLLTVILVFVFLPHNKPEVVLEKEIHPFLSLKKIESRNLVRISLLNLLFVLSFSGFEFVVNFFLSDTFQFSPKEIGFTFLYIGIIIILVQGGVVRRLSGKISEKRISLYGAVFVVIGMGLLVSFGTNFLGLFVSLFFLAFGSALVNPGLSSFASLESGKGDLGRSLGLFRSFGSLGRAVSPVVFSLLYFQKGPNLAFFVSFVLLVGFGFLLFTQKEKTT